MEIGDKIAEGLGMCVVDAQFKKEAGKQYLRLFIDKEGGVGIDDCEVFSRAFSDKIDELDPIEVEYTLEVSSPGVDRKLKTEREFMHYIGREVDVKLFKAKDGIKEFTGILNSYDNGVVTVDCDGEVTLDVKEAAFIRLHFDF